MVGKMQVNAKQPQTAPETKPPEAKPATEPDKVEKSAIGNILPTLAQKSQSPLAERFKVSRRLTRSLWALAHTRELAFQAQGEMYQAELAITSKVTADPLTWVLNVVNLETGEEGMLICSAVLRAALTRDSLPLNGRYFAVRAGIIREGKRYRDVDLVELTPVT